MGTKVNAIQDYADYIKCGEILKSPLQNYKNSIILKCFQCEDVHFFLEPFIIHIQEHFKNHLTWEEYESKTQYDNVQEDEIESEGVGIDNIAIKLEELALLTASEKAKLCSNELLEYGFNFHDPLFPIKHEINKETCNEIFEKDEINSQHSDISVEQSDEFENCGNSPDEYHPDDSDTDEEQIVRKPYNKRKKNDQDEPKDKNFEITEGQIVKELPNKRKTKLSPTVEEFMKSRSNVLTLIELYKHQPDLWNKYSPFYRLRDKRKQIFEEMAQSLKNKCSLVLNWNEVAEIISHIYGKHRDDFKRIQAQQTTKKKEKKTYKKNGNLDEKSDRRIKCCWFFDDLNFLRSKIIIRIQNLESNLPDLTSEQIIKILEIYQSFPHLWNTYLIENICSNKRHDALVEMIKVLETKMNLTVSKSALEQYLHTIHNYFSRGKRQRLEAQTKEDYQKSSKYNTPKYYESMMFLEDHEGPFHCSECNGMYTKPLCFRVHKSQHDGSMPLICSQCKQEFKSVASYTTHAKRHLEDLQFICKECNMKFLRHSDLKIHLLTHTDARPYCCEICGASYRQSNSFRKHQRRHENRFSHTCHICSKGYYTKYRYVDHMNSHMNIRSHICKICSKGFITSRALKTHSVTHEDARNHACNLCGKTFKLKIGVLQHMRTHGSKVEADDKRKVI